MPRNKLDDAKAELEYSVQGVQTYTRQLVDAEANLQRAHERVFKATRELSQAAAEDALANAAAETAEMKRGA